MQKRVPNLIQQKRQKKVTMLTAYDCLTARLISQSDIDMILVGDSLGQSFSGYESTIPVTVDEMVYHTKAVMRGNDGPFVVADMPFLSYTVSLEEAKRNAGRLIKEGGAHGVKLEVVGPDCVDTAKAIVGMGIPVVGHLGFTPQAIHQIGGYKIQGRDSKQSDYLIDMAKKLEDAGCFAIVLELVPSDLAMLITDSVDCLTIGIGAGGDCDGQVLVTLDLLGFNPDFNPKFLKKYETFGEKSISAISAYKKDVESATFPGLENGYSSN
ncbi:3-methyl-2-oxobutanoate hydroxymethyltransferase [bacterium]|nr:3-methyl-2-oxobutanoate hydroxymethyltransferase [bacterium]